jgi:hypothetical protein
MASVQPFHVILCLLLPSWKYRVIISLQQTSRLQEAVIVDLSVGPNNKVYWSEYFRGPRFDGSRKRPNRMTDTCLRMIVSFSGETLMVRLSTTIVILIRELKRRRNCDVTKS